MYASINFKTKKAFKEAIQAGRRITLYAPGLGAAVQDGEESVSGPWFPKPHTWYGTATVKNGIVVGVK